MNEQAYPKLRYPAYVVEYLAEQHGFAFPESAPVERTDLYDHLFMIALEAQRIRVRGLPGLIKGLTEEIGWVSRSLSAAPKDGKPATVYEQIGENLTDGMTLYRAVRLLNQREHEINQLCRALEKLTAPAQ